MPASSVPRHSPFRGREGGNGLGSLSASVHERGLSQDQLDIRREKPTSSWFLSIEGLEAFGVCALVPFHPLQTAAAAASDQLLGTWPHGPLTTEDQGLCLPKAVSIEMQIQSKCFPFRPPCPSLPFSSRSILYTEMHLTFPARCFHQLPKKVLPIKLKKL